MVTVSFQLTNTQPVQANIQDGTNLMTAALNQGLPVGSSCGGKGICGKCVMTIVKGHTNLSLKTVQEEKFFERNKQPPDQDGVMQRLSCQTQVNGNIEVKTSYW